MVGARGARADRRIRRACRSSRRASPTRIRSCGAPPRKDSGARRRHSRSLGARRSARATIRRRWSRAAMAFALQKLGQQLRPTARRVHDSSDKSRRRSPTICWSSVRRSCPTLMPHLQDPSPRHPRQCRRGPRRARRRRRRSALQPLTQDKDRDVARGRDRAIERIKHA